MSIPGRKPIDFDALNRTALSQISALCQRWLPRGRRSGNWWSASNPTRTDRNPSLGVSLQTGHWTDYGTGERGDLIGLYAHLHNLGQYEAALRLAEEVGAAPLPDPRKTPAATKAAEDRARRNGELALQIWRESQPAAGTLVEGYLRARGITIPVPPSIRFHSALRHSPSGELLPAMVAAVQGPDRRVLAVHRTYLKPDGAGKAMVEKPKLMLGPCAGGCVRFGPAQDEVHVAEGLETALAAQQATGLPTWAALSTSGLRSLLLPPEVHSVVILADGDAPGLAAADDAARRWIREGRRVRIAKPPSGRDMADLLLEGAA